MESGIMVLRCADVRGIGSPWCANVARRIGSLGCAGVARRIGSLWCADLTREQTLNVY